jgi:hypothetical protein
MQSRPIKTGQSAAGKVSSAGGAASTIAAPDFFASIFLLTLVFVNRVPTVLSGRGPLRHSSCQSYKGLAQLAHWRKTTDLKANWCASCAPVVRQFANLVIRHGNILLAVLRVIPA